MQTDASTVGIGGCLSVIRNGVELPPAFYSQASTNGNADVLSRQPWDIYLEDEFSNHNPQQ